MRSTQDLHEFIERRLAAPLATLEQRRLEQVARYNLIKAAIIGGALLLSLVSIVLMFIWTSSGCSCFFPFVFAFLAYYGVATAKNTVFGGSFRDDFKREVISPLVQFIDPSLVYQPNGRIAIEDFNRSGIFQIVPSDYQGEDLIRGRIGQTRFEVCELKASNVVQTPNRKNGNITSAQTVLIHKGLYFVADFHRPLQGFTILLPRRAPIGDGLPTTRAQLTQAMFAPWLARLSVHQPLVEVLLGIPEFDAQFQIYSTRESEALLVLTPGLVERVLQFRRGQAPKERTSAIAAAVDELEGTSGDNAVHISFVGSKFYFARRYHQDLFEPDPFRPFTQSAHIEVFFEDLQFALGVVDELNVNALATPPGAF
ncbi:MAG: DUF3137 domain-containing protein [Bradymonadaceae bacterium]|nr:DUF3137 domain-containing protein [Lujinxingiaceae bacterium]